MVPIRRDQTSSSLVRRPRKTNTAICSLLAGIPGARQRESREKNKTKGGRPGDVNDPPGLVESDARDATTCGLPLLVGSRTASACIGAPHPGGCPRVSPRAPPAGQRFLRRLPARQWRPGRAEWRSGRAQWRRRGVAAPCAHDNGARAARAQYMYMDRNSPPTGKRLTL